MDIINNKEDFYIKTGTAALVDFYADWCGECVAMTPFLEEAEAQSEIPFYRFDCDSDREFVMELGIMSIPTLMVFKGGEMVYKTVGVTSEDELFDELARFTD